MKALRTPDSYFKGLPNYEFSPHYAETGEGLRLHYVDEGPKDGAVVIMMHGEPSWSYLYRHMIKAVAEAGFRVLAPDLIGFGRSDKPTEQSDYSYTRHVAWIQNWFDQMDVKDAVLFCQDWGGLIGLRIVAENESRFAGVIAGNTFLPTGDRDPGEIFKKWQEFAKTVPEFPVGGIIRGATVKPLDEGVEEAYNSPFPDESYKAGARIFPALVPTSSTMDGVKENLAAWEVFKAWSKPFLTCFSDQDPITKGGDKAFQKLIPGCEGQPHQLLKGGGHFLQEDLSDELSTIIIDFCKSLSEN